ncbi:hypothetical protein D3C76_1592670 [compost metagenome]
MNNHVDGVDAVQLQILIQARLRGDGFRRNFKQGDQESGDFLINGFVFCSHGKFGLRRVGR